MNPNPYKTVTTDVGRPGHRHWSAWLDHIAWLFPFIMLAAPYVTWVVAWMVLGHRPRPSLDDPTSVSTVATGVYTAAGCILLLAPGVAVAGVLWQFMRTHTPILRRCLLAAVLCVTWVLCVFLLRWDPLRVMDWFMD